MPTLGTALPMRHSLVTGIHPEMMRSEHVKVNIADDLPSKQPAAHQNHCLPKDLNDTGTDPKNIRRIARNSLADCDHEIGIFRQQYEHSLMRHLAITTAKKIMLSSVYAPKKYFVFRVNLETVTGTTFTLPSKRWREYLSNSEE